METGGRFSFISRFGLGSRGQLREKEEGKLTGVKAGTIGTSGDMSCHRLGWPSDVALGRAKIRSLRSHTLSACVCVKMTVVIAGRLCSGPAASAKQGFVVWKSAANKEGTRLPRKHAFLCPGRPPPPTPRFLPASTQLPFSPSLHWSGRLVPPVWPLDVLL